MNQDVMKQDGLNRDGFNHDPAIPSRAFLDQLTEALPHLRGAAYMMTRAKADADDLIQTTAVRALAAFSQFTLGTNIRAWLYCIMRNEFIDMVRGRGRNPARLDEMPEVVVKRKETQEEALEMRDVMRAINTLTDIHREALYLSCVEGLSYNEIATIQACAVGTVKSRISRARQDMRALLEHEDVPESDERPVPHVELVAGNAD